MQVHQVMTHEVQCVGPNDSIVTAASKMRDLDVGPIPVCGDNDRLVGIITDRDIAIRGVARACDPKNTRVSEVMTPNIIYCYEDDDVSEAARLMEENQVRRLVVLNRDKRLVGILSLGDIAVKCGDDMMSGEALEQVSEPAVPRG